MKLYELDMGAEVFFRLIGGFDFLYLIVEKALEKKVVDGTRAVEDDLDEAQDVLEPGVTLYNFVHIYYPNIVYAAGC